MVKNTKGGSSHKKIARKNEDENKIIKVDLSINFDDCCIVLIDKNLGNCFTSRVLHYTGQKKEINDRDIKVLHQRGKTAKKTFDRSYSRIALVSLISDFRLTSGCLGYVEEILEIEHLNAYLKNNLISLETYEKLNRLMISKVSEQNDKGDDEGFIFDRNLNGINEEYLNEKRDGAGGSGTGGSGAGGGGEVGEEKEINLDDL